jgi:hypothetical protein
MDDTNFGYDMVAGATSDGHGQFVFEGLPPGDYRAFAQADGWASMGGRARAAEPDGGTLELSLPRAVPVAGLSWRITSSVPKA